MKINEFTDLISWQKAHQLVLSIYEITTSFPQKELYGLNSQMRRSSASVSANIAEGFSRKSRAEKIHFYRIGLGSLIELQDQLFIARDVNYLDGERFNKIYMNTVEVKKLILGSIKACPDYK